MGHSDWNILRCVDHAEAALTASVAYGALQVPCTILVARVSRPAIFLSVLVVLWATASTCMGFVRTFGQALTCRLLLALSVDASLLCAEAAGSSESPFWGVVALLLSRHYTRAEVGTRVGCLFVGELGANAVVGLFVASVTGPL